MRVYLLLAMVGLPLLATTADAGQEPWAIYYPGEVRGSRDCAFTLPDSTVGTAYLLRPGNAPGKPLPLSWWPEKGRGAPTAVGSPSLGMYAVTCDSCWEKPEVIIGGPPCNPPGTPTDTVIARRCLPVVSVFDTTGALRLSVADARRPAWSPDGRRLAYINVRSAWADGDGLSFDYPETPQGVTVFAPIDGTTRSFPVPTDALSWLTDEALMLEARGRRYALNVESGRSSRSSSGAVEPTFMAGIVSPDDDYIYRQGSLRVWSLRGAMRDYSGAGADTTDAPEGIDKDLTDVIRRAIGGTPSRVSGASFWVRGEGHRHDLCLGISWGRQQEESRDSHAHPAWEVIVIDVHRGRILKRIAGTFLAPSVDQTSVAVVQNGKVVFIPI